MFWRPLHCYVLRFPQFHDSKIKFPLTTKTIRPSSRSLRTIFKAKRPSTAMF